MLLDNLAQKMHGSIGPALGIPLSLKNKPQLATSHQSSADDQSNYTDRILQIKQTKVSLSITSFQRQIWY